MQRHVLDCREAEREEHRRGGHLGVPGGMRVLVLLLVVLLLEGTDEEQGGTAREEEYDEVHCRVLALALVQRLGEQGDQGGERLVRIRVGSG